MSSVNPFVPTRAEFAELRKQWRTPTQAPLMKGAILKPTAPQFAKLRDARPKPPAAPVMKGAPTGNLTAAQFEKLRLARRAPSQAQPLLTKVVVRKK